LAIARRVVSPFAGVVNRVRYGFPSRYFQGAGRIGDDLMCSVVFRELRKRSKRSLAIVTSNPSLFERNPDVAKIIPQKSSRLNRWGRAGLPVLKLIHTGYDPAHDLDLPPKEHVLIHMCRLAGITGPVELRPYIFLTEAELAAGRLGEEQVAIQSTGLAGPFAMHNREWYPQRFQELCAQLRSDVQVVQVGSASDMKLEGAIDLRGKTSLRQTAAVLANSLVFIGLAGFVMHLARAVDCRSVIVYGGREKPAITGYVANKNLFTQVRCAPCWLRNPCDFNRKCMDMISVEDVIAATADQIARYGTLLEVQTAVLSATPV
ncbi:MAG TPA: glycosyltransferase family 9 protein, partial [Candidatus Acidoferrales bacterium]|nr:glycosyltransferase family 9 protein [Candidatus Acidoferrales bacterium]